MQGNNIKDNEKINTASQKPNPSADEVLKGDLIGQWRKAKQGLLGKKAVVSDREVNEIRRDLAKEYGWLGKHILIREIDRFWLPKEKMTDLEKECIEKGRTVGAFRWWMQRKVEKWGEADAKKSEASRAKAKNEKAKVLARQVVKRHQLTEKINEWIHEELSPEPEMFATGRLQQWLEKSSGLRDGDDIEYEAKKKIERWASKQMEVRKAERMKELREQDPVLWAKLVIGRSPQPLEDFLTDPLYAEGGMRRYREAAKILIDKRQTSQPQGAGEGES